MGRGVRACAAVEAEDFHLDKALDEWTSQGNKLEDFLNEDYLEKHPRGRAFVEKQTDLAKAKFAESKPPPKPKRIQRSNRVRCRASGRAPWSRQARSPRRSGRRASSR